MGAAASVKNEEEIRQMDTEQLAKYAEDNKMNKFVSDTIRKKDVDGELVYQLDDGDLLELADNKNLQKKRLSAAFGQLPRGGTRGKHGGGVKPQSKEQQQLSDILKSYNEHSYLLIFACNKYPKTDKLDNLDCAVADGKLIEKTFKQHNFKVLGAYYDEDCTRDNIEHELRKLMKLFPYEKKIIGRVYIMFAGHGLEDKISGSSLFCCHDYNDADDYNTAYPLNEMKNKIQRIGMKHIALHFDCCHAGGIFMANRARKVDFHAESMAKHPTVSAITAVTASEEALGRNGNGVFTNAICKYLDVNTKYIFDSYGSDYVTLTQLFSNVTQDVTTEANSNGATMTPMHRDILQQHVGEQCSGEMLFFLPQTDLNYVNDIDQSSSSGGATRGTSNQTLPRKSTQDLRGEIEKLKAEKEAEKRRVEMENEMKELLAEKEQREKEKKEKELREKQKKEEDRKEREKKEKEEARRRNEALKIQAIGGLKFSGHPNKGVNNFLFTKSKTTPNTNGCTHYENCLPSHGTGHIYILPDGSWGFSLNYKPSDTSCNSYIKPTSVGTIPEGENVWKILVNKKWKDSKLTLKHLSEREVQNEISKEQEKKEKEAAAAAAAAKRKKEKEAEEKKRKEEEQKLKELYKTLIEKYKNEFPRRTPLVCACEKGRVEDVEGMIRGARAAGMDVTAMVSERGTSSGGYSSTPLIAAALCEHSTIIEILLQCNADTATTDNDGYNALHWAAWYNKTTTTTVQLLLNNMKLEDINHKNTSGFTPLDYCYNNDSSIKQQLIDLIRQKGGKRKSEL